MSLFTSITGTTPGVFIGITIVFLGGCAAMAGQALAKTWRPLWHALPYALLFGGADRFLVYALFNGQFLSLTGYVVDTACLLTICVLAYRSSRASQMVSQYPWLYKRAGLFGWTEKAGQNSAEHK